MEHKRVHSAHCHLANIPVYPVHRNPYSSRAFDHAGAVLSIGPVLYLRTINDIAALGFFSELGDDRRRVSRAHLISAMYLDKALGYAQGAIFVIGRKIGRDADANICITVVAFFCFYIGHKYSRRGQKEFSVTRNCYL